MSLENLTNDLPAYAKDIKLNLLSLIRSTALGETQLWGMLLASALASRPAGVSGAFL